MKPEFAFNYIGEFIRILRPGGVIVMQEPTERLPVQTTEPPEEVSRGKALLKYGIPVADMKAFVHKHGAIVKAAVPDESCMDWASVCYLISNDKTGNS